MIVLREEKKRMTMPLLKQCMAEDKELKKILTTPLSEMDEQYQNLFPEESREYYRDATLRDILDLYYRAENYGTHNFLSFAEDKPIGWISYRVEGDIVAEVNVIAFYLDRPNISLIRDLHRLVNELLEDYSEVRYQSLDSNPVKDAYDRFAKMHGCEPKFEDGMWNYVLKEEVSASSFSGEIPENVVATVDLIDHNATEELKRMTGRKINEKVYTSNIDNPSWEEVKSWLKEPQGFIDWLNKNDGANEDIDEEFSWIFNRIKKDDTIENFENLRKVQKYTMFIPTFREAMLTLIDAHDSWESRYLHRVLLIQSCNEADLRETELGCHWAFDVEGMMNFAIDNKGIIGKNWDDLICELTAETPMDNIHWALSLLCLLTFGNEHEVRVIDDSKIHMVRKQFYPLSDLSDACYIEEEE